MWVGALQLTFQPSALAGATKQTQRRYSALAEKLPTEQGGRAGVDRALQLTFSLQPWQNTLKSKALAEKPPTKPTGRGGL